MAVHVQEDRPDARREVSLPLLLFAFLGAATAWIVHFNFIYFLVALFCTEQWPGATAAVLLGTVPFAALSAAAGIVSYRLWQRLREGRALADELVEQGGRITLFLLMGLMGSVLFTVLIVIESLPPLFVPVCEAVVS